MNKENEKLSLRERIDRHLKAVFMDHQTYGAINDGKIIIQALVELIGKAEEMLKNYLSGDYENPRQYRPGKCPHGAYYYEECEVCNDAYIEQTLKSISMEENND